MQLRCSKFTNNLSRQKEFYTQVLNLEIRNEFKIEGDLIVVVLGHNNLEWEFEFTESKALVNHPPSRTDFLVLYYSSDEEIHTIKKSFENRGGKPIIHEKTHSQNSNTEINDPDGNKIMLRLKDHELDGNDLSSSFLLEKGVRTWSELLTFVKSLPYGRNATRSDFSLVLKEGKGTCSSKHALLKTLAEVNQVKGVKLIMGIYKMNAENTPGIGNHLESSGLAFIPEAHCYLSIFGIRIDLTKPEASLLSIQDSLLEEVELLPIQVVDYKVQYHQDYLKRWIVENKIKMTFEDVWSIRESCIAELAR